MHDRQVLVFEALVRVETFLNTNAGALGEINDAPVRLKFDEVMAGLRKQGGDQPFATTLSTSATVEKNRLREELRIYHMQPIAALAQLSLTNAKDIARLRLPPKRTDDKGLIAAGTAMVRLATEHRKVFLAQKLPPDFIAQLKAAVSAVRDARARRDAARLKRRTATRGMQDQLRLAGQLLTVLNALVVKQLRDRPDLVAAWRMTKRYRRKPGGARATMVSVGAEPTSAAGRGVGPSRTAG